MSIKLRIQGDEKVVDLYSNLAVKEFLNLVSGLANMLIHELKITMVEETRLTRIDTQVWNKEDLNLPVEARRLNLLKDVKAVHNAAFMIDKKMPDEMEVESNETSLI